MRRRVGYLLAWLVAAGLAIAVGTAAISTVGASIRGRGPLGNEVVRGTGPTDRLPSPEPGAGMRRDTVDGEFGTFRVGCRGVVAYGIGALPDRAAGWRVVSYEPGPDDDVDAVFSNRLRSVDIEVFCNRGEPTVAELERNELPDGD
jgi:hypothetical protein